MVRTMMGGAVRFADLLDPAMPSHQRGGLGDELLGLRLRQLRQIRERHIAGLAAVPTIRFARAGMSAEHHNLLPIT
jgi:hypothetical protein